MEWSFGAGIFTNLTQDHLDFHETLEDYFAEQGGGFSTRVTGFAVISCDDLPVAGADGPGSCYPQSQLWCKIGLSKSRQ